MLKIDDKHSIDIRFLIRMSSEYMLSAYTYKYLPKIKILDTGSGLSATLWIHFEKVQFISDNTFKYSISNMRTFSSFQHLLKEVNIKFV